jgi:hypothetical protein
MIEHHRSSISGGSDPSPTAKAAKEDALRDDPEKGRRAGEVDIIAMVRSLQRSAGVMDCFRIGNADCDMTDCEWRSYCLGAAPAPPDTDPAGPKT